MYKPILFKRMKKYRIVEITYKDGSKKYQVQKKVSLLSFKNIGPNFTSYEDALRQLIVLKGLEID